MESFQVVVNNDNDCDIRKELLRVKIYLGKLEERLGKTYSLGLYNTYVLIPYKEHKIDGVKGYLVLDNLGNEVQVTIKILSNKGVEIFSNVNMNNLTITLF